MRTQLCWKQVKGVKWKRWFFSRSFGMMLWLDLSLTVASASSGRSPPSPWSLKVTPSHCFLLLQICYNLYIKICNCDGFGLDLDGGEGSKYQRSMSMPASPATPITPVTPTTPLAAARKDNVWRSVFNPGRNFATKTIGAEVFDKPQPNSPTVYDW